MKLYKEDPCEHGYVEEHAVLDVECKAEWCDGGTREEVNCECNKPEKYSLGWDKS